jgi:hypothetical protein
MVKRLGVYDARNVVLIAAAIPVSDGLADEFVVVEADDDAFSEESGPDGAVMRYATGNTLYTVTVNLKGYSEHNAQFSALHALDVNSLNGAGIGIFLLKDNNGSTLMSADKCWIKKAAPKTLGKTLPDCAWVFKVVANAGTMLVGGN